MNLGLFIPLSNLGLSDMDWSKDGSLAHDGLFWRDSGRRSGDCSDAVDWTGIVLPSSSSL